MYTCPHAARYNACRKFTCSFINNVSNKCVFWRYFPSTHTLCVCLLVKLNWIHQTHHGSHYRFIQKVLRAIRQLESRIRLMKLLFFFQGADEHRVLTWGWLQYWRSQRVLNKYLAHFFLPSARWFWLDRWANKKSFVLFCLYFIVIQNNWFQAVWTC